MANDNLHPVFGEYFDKLLNKPSALANPAPSEDPAPAEDPIFGKVIYSYSRAQALDDGVLVDLGLYSYRGRPIPAQVGIRHPMAITATAFGVVAGGQPTAEDELRLIIEFCLAFKDAARLASAADRLLFTFRGVQLKAICGPGDDAEPVITLMLPDED